LLSLSISLIFDIYQKIKPIPFIISKLSSIPSPQNNLFNNYKKQLVEKARVRLDEGKWRIGPPEVQRPQTPPAPQPNR